MRNPFIALHFPWRGCKFVSLVSRHIIVWRGREGMLKADGDYILNNLFYRKFHWCVKRTNSSFLFLNSIHTHNVFHMYTDLCIILILKRIWTNLILTPSCTVGGCQRKTLTVTVAETLTMDEQHQQPTLMNRHSNWHMEKRKTGVRC